MGGVDVKVANGSGVGVTTPKGGGVDVRVAAGGSVGT
jgi:hypothetical protein